MSRRRPGSIIGVLSPEPARISARLYGVATDDLEFVSAEECLAHAETCEHAARFLSGPDELQRVLLEIAALWRKRARGAAARSKA